MQLRYSALALFALVPILNAVCLATPSDSSDFCQSFPRAARRRLGHGNSLTVRSRGGSHRYTPGKDVDTSGLSTAGEVSGSIVFVGYGIHAPQAHHDDYAGMDVKGKVVLVLDGFPGDSSHSPLAKFNDVRRKAAMARALGAVAFINVVTKDAFRRGIGRTLEEATDAGMPLMRVRSTIAEQWIREATQKGLPEIWDDADAGKFVSMPLGATAHLKTDIRKILKTSRT